MLTLAMPRAIKPGPRQIPTEDMLQTASELDLLTEDGRAVPFGTLFEDRKTLAVFIRHFWCATCQASAYVMQLASIPGRELDDANVRVVVIGCGSWDLIPSYKEITGFNGEVFADPSRSTFRALQLITGIQGFRLTPSNQQRKSYMTRVTNNTLLYGLRNLFRLFFKDPRFATKIGSMSQLGGDFIFEPGPTCTFASRMQHMEDHVEVSELAQHLGIAARPPSPTVLLTNLTVGERSQRDCSGLLPDQLVVVPSQKESFTCVTVVPR